MKVHCNKQTINCFYLSLCDGSKMKGCDNIQLLYYSLQWCHVVIRLVNTKFVKPYRVV